MREKPPIIKGTILHFPYGHTVVDITPHLEAQRDADLSYIEHAKRDVAEDIGGLTCCLAGNLMLEDKEAGMLLAKQLQPLVDTIKLRYLPDLPRKAIDLDSADERRAKE